MALETNDLLALKGMGNNGNCMTPYEQFRMADKQSKRPSGVGIAGLVVGTVGAAAAIGAWIFGGTYASSKAAHAREAAQAASTLATANHANTLALMNQAQTNQNATIDRLIKALQRETDARAGGDQTISQTITDTLSGSQSGTLTAQQQSDLNAVQTATQNLLTQAMLGNISENPQKVSLYSAPQPCPCPCGCNG